MSFARTEGHVKARTQELLPQAYSRMGYAETECLITERFEKILLANPDKVAIEDSAESLTYAEFDKRSTAFAGTLLRDLGSRHENVVLIMSQGNLFCIAQFGVWKSGKFFTCINGDEKFARLVKITKFLQARMLVCDEEHSRLCAKLAAACGNLHCINISRLDLRCETTLPAVNLSCDDIASVSLTSGTTGEPNGVVVSHRTVLQYTMNHINNLHINPEDRVSQICPTYAGFNACEIFPILLSGATVLPYVINTSGAGNLARWLNEKKISIFTAVPAVFRLMLENIPESELLDSVRLVRLSGDKISLQDVKKFNAHFSSKCLLRVGLGTSETYNCTQYFIHKGDEIPYPTVPLGFPLPGIEIFILDDQARPLGFGEIGEIGVKSEFNTPGYWNNPDLTRKKFLIDPADHRKSLYLTGDLGYLDERGCLFHAGRNDYKVKINGKFVSLIEIEEKILDVAGVSECAVIGVEGRNAALTLIGFFSSTIEVDGAHLIRVLRDTLSPDMIPKKLVAMNEIPKTGRFKIDRKRLREICETHAIHREKNKVIRLQL